MTSGWVTQALTRQLCNASMSSCASDQMYNTCACLFFKSCSARCQEMVTTDLTVVSSPRPPFCPGTEEITHTRLRNTLQQLAPSLFLLAAGAKSVRTEARRRERVGRAQLCANGRYARKFGRVGDSQRQVSKRRQTRYCRFSACAGVDSDRVACLRSRTTKWSDFRAVFSHNTQ